MRKGCCYDGLGSGIRSKNRIPCGETPPFGRFPCINSRCTSLESCRFLWICVFRDGDDISMYREGQRYRIMWNIYLGTDRACASGKNVFAGGLGFVRLAHDMRLHRMLDVGRILTVSEFIAIPDAENICKVLGMTSRKPTVAPRGVLHDYFLLRAERLGVFHRK